MVIRNIVKSDIANIDRLQAINWDSIDESLSFLMFDGKGDLICDIIIQKKGKCPDEIFEDETNNYKILDIFIRDDSAFGTDVICFRRLFWMLLTCDNYLSMFWTEATNKYGKLLKRIRFEEIGQYLSFYKSKNYLL